MTPSSPLVGDGDSSDRRRALFAALSVLLPFALWYTALYKRGAAYLLLDLALSGRSVALLHLSGLLVGVLAASRLRRAPPWYPPLLLLAFVLAVVLALLGAFPAFSSGPVFVPFALSVAALSGLLLGAYALLLARLLASLRFDRAALLDLLKVDALALALVAGVLYLLASERLGPLRVGLLLALGCALVGHLGLSLVAPRAASAQRARRAAAGFSYTLAVLQFLVEPLTPIRESGVAPDPVVLVRNSLNSRLVLTSGRGAFQLYVDGLLRMSTIDAARRREAAVHPAMQAAARRQRVLLIGGGDGGAVRELLRYQDVEQITVVEPEWSLLEVAATQPILLHENDHALASPRVRAVRMDPVVFLPTAGLYDVIVLDLLDPEGPRRSKWFTRHFFRALSDHLAPGGVGAIATNTSPLAQRQAFWCVLSTLEAAGFQALPYRAQLPTMGPWGYALFARGSLAVPSAEYLPPGLLSLDPATLRDLFDLAPDEQRVAAEVNLLHHQVLVRYRQQGEGEISSPQPPSP